MAQKKCSNNGCGRAFTDEENSDTACIYHSGAAVFHEGMKGWSCCKKRVISFEEFMDIPGCSSGTHVAEEQKVAPSQPEPKMVAPSPAPTTPPPVAATPPPPKPAVAKPAPPPPAEEEDPPNAVITPGTLCKRLSCNQLYHDERSRTETCFYHPGVPVFHEGSKGYNCCKMVGDFDEFLRMPGCRKGKHKFIETKKIESSNQVACRHDWYQMGPNVVVCVYAKGIDKANSTIKFSPRSLDVTLVLPEDKQYSKVFSLSEEIDPSKSKFEILSTKVEIKLYKTVGNQWATLE